MFLNVPHHQMQFYKFSLYEHSDTFVTNNIPFPFQELCRWNCKYFVMACSSYLECNLDNDGMTHNVKVDTYIQYNYFEK